MSLIIHGTNSTVTLVDIFRNINRLAFSIPYLGSIVISLNKCQSHVYFFPYMFGFILSIYQASKFQYLTVAKHRFLTEKVQGTYFENVLRKKKVP